MLAGGVVIYSFPINIEWNITNFCNLNCSFCSVCASRQKDFHFLDENKINHVVANIKDSGCIYTSISGGEPMSHPLFFYIVEDLIKSQQKVTLATNGTFFTEEKVSKLEKLGIHHVQVSLLGGNAKSNNLLMGGLSYDKIWNAIKLLKSAKFGFTVSVLRLDENQSEIETIKKQLEGVGVKYLIRGLSKVGKAKDNQQAELVSSELQKRQRCSCFFSIMNNGDVRPCGEFDIQLGNVFIDSIKNIWTNNQKIMEICDSSFCPAERVQFDTEFRSFCESVVNRSSKN